MVNRIPAFDSSKGKMPCTDPLPKLRTPTIVPRPWSRMAPAKISAALALSWSMITTSGICHFPCSWAE